MVKQAFILLLLMGCGTEAANLNSNATTPAAKDSSGIVYQPTETPTKDVTVEYRKTGNDYALAVDDTADMPACGKENNQQLVYVKKLDTFFSCEGDWKEIVIKGPAGSDGAPGVAGTGGGLGASGRPGEAGEAGAAGKDGAKGEKGDKGDPGQPVAVNQWFDQLTQNSWLIGAVESEGQFNASLATACGGGWRIPTAAEAQTAAQHGLILASQAIGGPQRVWTSDFSTTACGSVNGVEIESCRAAVAAGGATYRTLAPNSGAFCIGEPK